ncbi:hypothetical protein Sp245p_15985 (plasmid) [Azospirillum baldaniorum]|uniref:Uncharacterized protein n=1 Tax=Azospirillum baldaniorum TaxID=1064539 RepID=A0A9P1NNE9_9PROT|nr:hypothetical protein Sp245p_15985 [Azospirillum baldaniorum]CCC99609.1 protein of unknown function [Azospirillum baldaniorum]
MQRISSASKQYAIVALPPASLHSAGLPVRGDGAPVPRVQFAGFRLPRLRLGDDPSFDAPFFDAWSLPAPVLWPCRFLRFVSVV